MATEWLYDNKGYEIRLDMTRTYNPNEATGSEDHRNLGVLLQYLGADVPEHEELTYEHDPYVLSRIEFPMTIDWNYQALRGFWGAEENGTWLDMQNTAYLRDTGIRKSGLRITYYVPQFLLDLNASLCITVCGDVVAEIPLNEEGVFTQVLDVGNVGQEERDYLDQSHRILKTLLVEFDRVCTKYNLHYYLICGSLLGAVRHGDLIPWDDDVDVAMPRKDFEILLQHAQEEWGDSKEFLYLNYDQMGGHAFLDYLNRLVYMGETIPVNVFRKIQGKGRADIGNHMPMDIYVLDNASDSEQFHMFQTQFIRGLYGLAMGHRAYINPADYENRDEQTQRIVHILSSIGRHLPLSWILGCYEWARKWNRNKTTENYFESNGFIYCIPWKFRQEWFGEGVRLPLGDITVNAPQNYEAFLHMHYGDYMQYPSSPMREPTHSVEASGIF